MTASSKSADEILFDGERRLVSFIFRVPVQLPFGPMGTIALAMAGLGPSEWHELVRLQPMEGVPPPPEPINMRQARVSLRFFQIKRREPLTDLMFPIEEVAKAIYGFEKPKKRRKAAASKPKDLEDYDTVVEGVTQGFVTDREALAPNIAAACLERVLAALNRLVVGAGIFLNDPSFSLISPRSLDPIAFVATRRTNDLRFDRGPILYLLNANIPAPRDPLTLDQQQRIMRNVGLLSRGHPFMNGLRLQLDARRAHLRGDNADALITVVAAGEYLLNTVLRCLMTEEGKSAEFEKLLNEQQSLAARVKAEYAPRLGGNWSIRDGSAISDWWRDAQGPRGRTVHGGYWPSHGEVDIAFAATKSLDDFVEARLVAKLRRYPKTALTKLGTRKLEALGVSRRRIDDLERDSGLALREFWRAIGTPIDIRGPD